MTYDEFHTNREITIAGHSCLVTRLEWGMGCCGRLYKRVWVAGLYDRHDSVGLLDQPNEIELPPWLWHACVPGWPRGNWSA